MNKKYQKSKIFGLPNRKGQTDLMKKVFGAILGIVAIIYLANMGLNYAEEIKMNNQCGGSSVNPGKESQCVEDRAECDKLYDEDAMLLADGLKGCATDAIQVKYPTDGHKKTRCCLES